MREQLSKYKFKKLAEESLRNGIRLHFDAILLFSHESYASALQLSIISMEEIAKAKWIEHYYFTSVTNEGFPEKEFEEKWLNLLYFHPRKQFGFLSRDLLRYSPKFVEFVETKKLEELKQSATYVGLKKIKGKPDVNSRISVPEKTKKSDAKKIISIINDELKEICEIKNEHEYYFWIDEMDYWIHDDLLDLLSIWNHKSGIRSKKWEKVWQEKFKNRS